LKVCDWLFPVEDHQEVPTPGGIHSKAIQRRPPTLASMRDGTPLLTFLPGRRLGGRHKAKPYT
jgi:hypothetical protein